MAVNKIEFKGRIPARVKAIASDFKVMGDVLVEKTYESKSYCVTVFIRPRRVDLDLFFIAMKKNSIDGFFIEETGRGIRFYIHSNRIK